MQSAYPKRSKTLLAMCFSCNTCQVISFFSIAMCHSEMVYALQLNLKSNTSCQKVCDALVSSHHQNKEACVCRDQSSEKITKTEKITDLCITRF